MRMTRILLAGLCGIVLAGCATGIREPKPNLGVLQRECVAWHDSGAYARAFARAAEPARKVLRGSALPPHAAVVFDIDETLLSNWPYLEARQFAITSASFSEWTTRERAVALEPMREVYQLARARGCAVFLVSGRRESLRKSTTRDLQEVGYDGWEGLFLRPDSDQAASVVPFKSGVRRQLVARGYAILLNVGDQRSDLDGGAARHRVKLPNPFYFIP